jgi:hypothetical protein
MTTSAGPLIIDVEASGFGPLSYPIEVGLALSAGEKYCSLILPAADWTHWDTSAEKIHRVSRDILEAYGTPLVKVAVQLNELLEGETVYSDGWVVDKPWLINLFHSAQIPMAFRVSPLEMILSESQMECWHTTKDCVTKEMGIARHRASADALIIQETYRRTLN